MGGKIRYNMLCDYYLKYKPFTGTKNLVSVNWSCAASALELHAKHGLEVSAWTVRCWLDELGWVWKRVKLVAKDNALQRVERLARIRWQAQHLAAQEVIIFADELDIPLLPMVRAAWMPKGSHEEVMTPEQNEKHFLPGALHLALGKILYWLGPRKNNALFRDLLTLPERTYPSQRTKAAVSMQW